jgi:hypothetical protein
MKKKLVFCLVFLTSIQLSAHLQALEFANAINAGELGLDTTFWPTAIYAHLINFTVQDENGFGIQVTPVRALLDFETKEFVAVTFVNASFYYNFFNIIEEIQLGPFVSINTVNVLKIDSVEYNVGLLFTLRTLELEFAKPTMVNSNWLTIKGGYKYRDGTSNFYAQIGCDLLTAAYVMAVSS